MKENKKEIRDSFITFPAGYYKKNLNIFSGNWPIACFCWNELKYHQRKVDLNTSQKSLVFVKIRHKISSSCKAIAYENFIFTQEYAFAERCCFLTCSFEIGKWKLRNINVFWVSFTTFLKTKIIFIIQYVLSLITVPEHLRTVTANSVCKVNIWELSHKELKVLEFERFNVFLIAGI